MDPAQDPCGEREWLSWTNVDVDRRARAPVLAEGLDEEAALVAVDLGLDQDEAVELGLEALRSHQPSEPCPYWRS